MAGKKDFRYIINTDLKLNTGSIQRLLEDVRTVDRAIRTSLSRNNQGISLPVKIDKQNAIRNIQTEVSQIVTGYNRGQAPTIKLGLGIDKNSLIALRRQISDIRTELNNVGTSAKNAHVSASLGIGKGETEKVQRQIGNIKGTATIGLRIDKNDLQAVEAQVRNIRSEVAQISNLQPRVSNTTNRNPHSEGTAGRFGVDNRRQNQQQPRNTVSPRTTSSRALLPNLIEMQKEVMAGRRALGNTNLQGLESDLVKHKTKMASLQKEIETITSKKTQATVNGATYKGSKQLTQAVEDRKKEIDKLSPQIKSMESQISKVKEFKAFEKEYLDLFNQLSRTVQIGKATALNKNHPVRIMVEAKRKDISDWDKLLDEAHKENKVFNEKLKARIAERENYPVGKASNLPKHHPLAQLNERNKQWDNMLNEAYAKNKSLDLERQKKIDALNSYPVGKASNLPKHHPVRQKVEAGQDWNKMVNNAYSINEKMKQKAQEKLDNTPMGKASSLPKHHPVRIRIDEIKTWNSMLDDAYKENRKLDQKRKAQQESFQNQVNNTPVGKASNLPKHHPVRQKIDEINAYNKMLNEAYAKNASIDKKWQDAINNMPTGTATKLPKYHPVRQRIEAQQAYERGLQAIQNTPIGKTSTLPVNHPVRRIIEMDNAHSNALLMNQQYDQRRKEFDQSTSRYGGNKEKKIKDLEMALRNPDIPLQEKTGKGGILEQIKRNNASIARDSGQTFTRSYDIFQRSADGTISKVRSLQYEFNRYGEAVQRGDRSLANMARNMSRNVLFYSAFSGAFYGIISGVTTAIKHMSEFEAQLTRIQVIATELGSGGQIKDMYSNFGDKSTFNNNVRRDVYDLATKYGLSATENIAPIEKQVMSRYLLVGGGKDLGDGKVSKADRGKVQHVTEEIVKLSTMALGPGAQADDQKRLSDDYLSLMQGLYVKGSDQHIGRMTELSDFMTIMNNSGVNVGNIMDSLSEIAPDAIKKGINEKQVAALLGAYNLSDSDASAASMTTVAKTYYGALAKYQDSSSVREGLNALGIDVTAKKYTQEELNNEVLNKYQTLTDGEKFNFASKISSLTGSGGKAMAPKVQKFLDASGSQYYDDFMSQQNTSGALDEANEKLLETLKAEFGKINEEVGHFVELMSELGAMDGLKAVIGTFKVMLQGVNAFLDTMTKIGTQMESVFGFNLPKFALQMTALAGSIKLAGMAFNKFAPGKASMIASSVGGALFPVGSFSSYGRNKGTVVTPNTRTSRNARGGGIGEFVGNTVGWIVAGKFADMFKGRRNPIQNQSRSVGRLAGVQVVNLFNKLGGALGKLLPTLLRFAGILSRLSLVGGAIAVAGLIATTAYKSYSDGVKKRYDEQNKAYEKSFGDTKNKKEDAERFVRRFDKWLGNNKNDRLNNIPVDSEYVNTGLSGGYGMYAGNTEKKKLTKEQMDMKKLQKEFADAGITYDSITTGSKYMGTEQTTDYITYNSKDKEGKDIRKKFNATDKKQFNKMVEELTGGQLTTEAKLTETWKPVSNDMKDYEQQLIKIDSLTEKFNKTMAKLGYETGKIDFKFLGSENSQSALSQKITAIDATMGDASSTINELQTKRGAIASEANRVSQELANYRNRMISEGVMKEDDLSRLEAQFKIGYDANDLEGMFNKYTVDDKTIQGWKENYKKKNDGKEMSQKEIDEKMRTNIAISGYLQSLNSNQGLIDADKKTEDQILATNQAILERQSMLKQLQTQLLVTQSGIEVFNAKISEIQMYSGKARTMLSLADNPFSETDNPEKIKRTVDLMKVMGVEAKAYQNQLKAVNLQMESLKAQNPGADFSTDTLYNPGENGLTSQQSAYKELLERQYQIHENINSSTLAMKEQRDALKEMILSSDKYADMWERVQNRIQLVKELNREIYNIRQDASLVNDFSKVRSAITGQKEQEVKAGKLESIRDRGLDVFEKAMTAVKNSGNDSKKLQEAWDEINKTMGSEFDAAFIDPLKQIIQDDFTKAGDSIKDGAVKINDGASKLDQVLTYWANNITSGLLTDQTTDFTDAMNGGGATIPGFEADIKDSGADLKGMSKSQLVAAYIKQNFGYGPGDKRYISTKKQLENSMTSEELIKELQKHTTDTKSNASVHEYAKTIDGTVKGLLKGHGADFVKSGAKYGVDPRLIAAITMAETGGTSARLKRSNNVGNLKATGWDGAKDGAFRKYNSIEEGIDDMTRLIAKYFASGKNTIEKIGNTYAPPSDDNEGWVPNVTKYYSAMTGISPGQLNGSTGALSSGAGISSTLRQGSTGDTVKQLQQKLGITADGIYGAGTAKAVSDYQKKNGLGVDGIAGSQTLSALGIGGTGPSTSSGGGSKLRGWNEITSNYGMRFHPIDKKNKMHEGVDIKGKTGDPLDSNVSGKVVYAGEGKKGSGYGGYGNVVAVQDSNGLVHMFAHLSKVLVKVGDQIAVGKQVGAIGATGKATGPHLHYEVRKNGKSIDPTSYANSARTQVSSGGASPISSALGADEPPKGPTPADLIKQGLQGFMESARAQAQINSMSNVKQSYYDDVQLSTAIAKINSPLAPNAVTGTFDRIRTAVEESITKRLQNTGKEKEISSLRKEYMSEARQAKKDGRMDEYRAYSAAITALDKMTRGLQRSNKELTKFEEYLKKQLKLDPRINQDEADKKLKAGYNKIRDIKSAGQTGSVDYYQTLDEVNQMNNSYMSTKKKLSISKELWDNTGFDTSQYNLIKRQSVQEDFNVMFKKISELNKILGDFAQGTFDWWVTLQDAVEVQKQLNEINKQRLQDAQDMFELTGSGLSGYINQKAYVQSSEYVQDYKNLDKAKAALSGGEMPDAYKFTTGTSGLEHAEALKYILKTDYNVNASIKQRDPKDKGSYYVETQYDLNQDRAEEIKKRLIDRDLIKRGYVQASDGGKMDKNEMLATMQIIAGLHDKMIQQMNDYRTAVVGAFKAGAMTLDTYMKRLNDLRDVQNEAKENAVKMVDGISQGFESVLSSSLLSGMTGDMNSTQSFVDGIKQTLASTISNQLSFQLLNNSGLQDVMNKIIKSVTTASTGGSASDIVNMFNNNDFGKQIQDAINPFLPMIEQISASTKGIFSILKDQLYNAPQGFKIDDYLYDMAKGKTFDGVKNWTQQGERNEAGSVIKDPVKTGTINVPPPSQTPGGVPTTPTTPIDPPAPSGPPPNTGSPSSGSGPIGYATVTTGQVLVYERQADGSMKPSYNAGAGNDLRVWGTTQAPMVDNNGKSTGSDGVWLSIGGGKFIRDDPKRIDYDAVRDSKVPVSSQVGKVDPNNANRAVTKDGKSMGGMIKYHTGGLAGVTNFSSAKKLRPNEVQAIMERGEIALQPGQIRSLVQGMHYTIKKPEKPTVDNQGFQLTPTVPNKRPEDQYIGNQGLQGIFKTPNISVGKGKEGGDLNLSIDVNVQGGSYDQRGIENAVEKAVATALSEFKRNQRLSNLQTRGTSYGY